MAHDRPGDSLPELTAQLEAALLRELTATYKHLNWTYFRDRLCLPLLELSRAESRLGQWARGTRTLELGRAFVLRASWGSVVEVLKHEMAHQFVDEVLGVVDEAPHGPAFRSVCKTLGIDHRSRGVPRASDGSPAESAGGASATDDAEARLAARIAKLLALAESPNQHEAEAAAAAAQRLMLKHNLERTSRAAPSDYSFRHLGRPTGRVTEAERILARILSKHFFVEVIWVPVYRPLEGKRASVLEACGTESNLRIAEYVHDFLMHTADALWASHKAAQALRSNRDRRTFLAGVMAGFAEKLDGERRESAASGLVWKGDGDLHAYYRSRHPRVRMVRSAGQRRNEHFAHGKAAGKGIVLRKGVEGGPSSGPPALSGAASRRLLPAAR
jgi:hypothetical protein